MNAQLPFVVNLASKLSRLCPSTRNPALLNPV